MKLGYQTFQIICALCLNTQTGWVLSSFFFGYIIMQIPGGFLAGVIGGRIVFGVGIVMTAILTLLTPLAARIHIGLLIALRVLEGFFEVWSETI